MTKINIPDKAYYVLERGRFESQRANSNLAFMCNANIDNQNWTDTVEFHELFDTAVEKYIQRQTLEFGIVGYLLGTEMIPDYYYISPNMRELQYQEEL